MCVRVCEYVNFVYFMPDNWPFDRTKKERCATEFMEILPFYLNCKQEKTKQTNMWQTSVKHMQLVVVI